MSEPFCPCFCAGAGALIGLMTTACIQVGCLPVIIGSSVGCGIGCVYSIYHFINECNEPDTILTADPIRIQNMAYTGEAKG